MVRNRLMLIGLTIMTGLLLSLIMVPSVLAGKTNNKINSTYDMHDNTNTPFTPELGGFLSHHDDPTATTEQETHGSGTFSLNPHALKNLKFSITIEASDLAINTEYGISVSIRDIPGLLDGPDGDVEVGMATTDGAGNLTFEGSAVLPNPVEVSPEGIATGWRIDQRITLFGQGTNLNNCINCTLVCSPTTKVMLNKNGNQLIPFVAP